MRVPQITAGTEASASIGAHSLEEASAKVVASSPKHTLKVHSGHGQGEVAHVSFKGDLNQGANTASGTAAPENSTAVGGAGGGDGLGQATSAHPGADSDGEDLFADTEEDE